MNEREVLLGLGIFKEDFIRRLPTVGCQVTYMGQAMKVEYLLGDNESFRMDGVYVAIHHGFPATQPAPEAGETPEEWPDEFDIVQ